MSDSSIVIIQGTVGLYTVATRCHTCFAVTLKYTEDSSLTILRHSLVVHSLERSQKYIRIHPVFLERFQNYILKILQTTVTLVLCLHCKGFFKLSQNMEGNIVQTKEYINRVYHALSFKFRYWILPMLHYFLLIVILKLWKQTHGNGCTPQFLTRHRSIKPKR